MQKQIILLNGPSSSGKSTLSNALQNLLEAKQYGTYEIISIDDFMKIKEDETIYEDDVFDISSDMCQKALEVLQYAPGVIIDHVITSPRIFNQLCEMLRSYPIFKVRVTCPLSVLIQREIARKNRCIGSAESSYTYLFPQEGYDLIVDTHANSSAECAHQIIKACYET
jgi:chloramphenicol 3-O phosphotransferase